MKFFLAWFHSKAIQTIRMSRNGRSSRLYMAEKETKRNGNFRVRSRSIGVLSSNPRHDIIFSQLDTMLSSFSSIMKNWKHFAVTYKMIFKYSKAQIWNWNTSQLRYQLTPYKNCSEFFQQLVIEWESREESCFGYVAMVSDAIPERNLMTFTKG